MVSTGEEEIDGDPNQCVVCDAPAAWSFGFAETASMHRQGILLVFTNARLLPLQCRK